MPSFNGQFIFGAACRMNTADEPRGTQTNAYFGLSGLEALDGGLRGRITTCSGLIFADTPSDCQFLVEIFRSFNDGNYYSLIDTAGFFWANVRLLDFRPQDRAFAHTQLGYTRAYTAAFIHLT